ncbi:MAG TPA: TlpA disulfide reductase family protein [Planctomycetaceae bacterium]|nr:TlpA disulfide reductase family protein [Planctomycetaceae bacterium]
MTPALAWMIATTLAAAPTVGTELQYTGTVSQVVRDQPSVEKNFTIQAVITGDTAQPALLYLLEERGSGGWAWPERFGRIELPAKGDAGLKVLHTFDGNPYPLPVHSPVFEFADKLAAGAEWTDGRDQYECVRSREVQGRTVWVVEVTLDRGRRQTLNVDAETSLLVSLEERLFLGRGDPFQMKLTLESRRTLSADELGKFTAPATALLALQRELNRPMQPRMVDLSAEQVQRSQEAIEKIRPQAVGTVWAKFLDGVDRDLANQTRRQAGVSGLEQKFVGQPATLSDLKLATGGPLPLSDLKGKTTVLHFWDYNGEKLIEPYGQVGYLDFLHNRRGKLGAKVVGVAVDARLADAAQSNAATRGIRKLREFMNLGFPIATDDGTLLKQFGDPRALGAELPLWVVIGHDGKIAHYKVGYYAIKPDEGLRELDAAVVEALKKEKASSAP